MYSPSGKRLHLKLDEPFAIYSRVAFDSYLRDRAREPAPKSSLKRSPREESRELKTAGQLRSAGNGRSESGRERCWSALTAQTARSRRSSPVHLQASDMEVAFGYRAPLPEQGDAPTVIAFLPGWVGYAWAFPRLDHISFGIATTQEAFEHKALDDLLWQFMIGYYRQREGRRQEQNIWTDSQENRRGCGHRERTCKRQPNVTPRAFPVWPTKPGTNDARAAKAGRCWVMPPVLRIR